MSYLTVKIDAAQFSAAAVAFGDRFDVQAAGIIDAAIRRSAEVVQRAVVKSAKRHRRSGRLESNIRIGYAGVGWDLAARVRSGGSVAHLVAGPVRAHAIALPSSARHPMPIYGATGPEGYARSVMHPATPGDPYFRRGANNARLAVNNVLKAAARRLAAHLADILKGP